MKKITIFLSLLIYIISCFSYTYAGVLEDAQKEKQNLQNEKNKIANEKNWTNENYGKINQILDDIINEEDTINQDIDITKEELAELDTQYSGILDGLSDAEEKYAGLYQLSIKRMNMAYQDKGISTLESLLSSNSIGDFFKRLYYITVAVEHDREILEELEVARLDLEEKKEFVYGQRMETGKKEELLFARLEDTQRREEISRGEAVQMKEKLASLERLEDQLEEKAKEIDQKIEKLLREEQEKKEKEAKAAEAAEKSKKAKMALEAAAAASTKAQTMGNVALSWPTPGYTSVSSPFGMRLHPISGVYKMHSGVDISAPEGANIKACADGKVIYSDWEAGGYGYYLIVDHGGGYTTLYAHCSKKLVSTGDWVTKGQTIARVGQTGAATGPHLHFEVRVWNVRKNPLDYVSR